MSISSDHRSGRVSEVPFGRIFGEIATRKITGALRLEQGGRRYALYFQEGAIADAESSSPEDTLGRVALESGLVDQSAVTETIKRMAKEPSKSQKDLFVELGTLRGDALAQAEKQTLARRTLRIFSLPQATFAFEAGKHGRLAGGPLEPRSALYQGLRAHYDDRRLHQEMGDHQGKAMRLLVPPEALSAFGFGKEEQLVISYLARAATKNLYWELGDLVEACATLPRALVLAVVHALGAFGALELAPAGSVQRCRKPRRDGSQAGPLPALDAKAPPTEVTRTVEAAPPPPNGTSPPSARSVAPAKITGEQIEAKFADLQRDIDDFAFLELERGASVEATRAAFIRLVKLYHPDKLPEPLRALKPKVDRIFARLTLANGNLADETKRAQVLKELAQGGAAAIKRADEQANEKARTIFLAEDHFKRGGWELRRQNFAGALEAFRTAVELHKEEADYWASLAYAKWVSAGDDKAGIKTDVFGDFTRASKLNPDCLDAHFYRGLVYEELGETDRAITCFQKVLALNADHVDAARHLRVLEMRRGKDDSGGFLGLFGRKKDKPDPKKPKDPEKKK